MPSRHRPAISDTLAQVCQECINYVNTDACLCSAHLDAAKQINAPPNDREVFKWRGFADLSSPHRKKERVGNVMHFTFE
ncbi:hypothetical protein E2C01_078589 [Portunus trituberculatus]|uniref:Uncharacterized protein n=1 Tax=Portunus trituberculatus TaxID=210409 RepID=A0A5B7IP75_PORTR|nr:hypothetical protein [Portunus trituberculatus]